MSLRSVYWSRSCDGTWQVFSRSNTFRGRICDLPELSIAHRRGSVVVYPRLPKTYPLQVAQVRLFGIGRSKGYQKPRAQKLTRGQKALSRRIARRQVGIEHVNGGVKRCHIVHDTCRLWDAGVRDLAMEVCCALHNFRVRLTPWQPL